MYVKKHPLKSYSKTYNGKICLSNELHSCIASFIENWLKSEKYLIVNQLDN